MRFGKIDYLNLLPFEVFVRTYPKPSHFSLFFNKRKSYPAHLNKEFLFSRIDAGFISSITALRAKKERFFALKTGIIAKKEVISVICLPKESGSDYQSATSNALLKVLNLKGRVLIGDRALKEVLKQQNEQKNDYLDLAKVWIKRERLPFVFGRLCVRKNRDFYEKMLKRFHKSRIKIPQYILNNASKSSQIKKQEILNYLKVLSYKLDKKAEYGVKRFFRNLRILQIKPPKRF